MLSATLGEWCAPKCIHPAAVENKEKRKGAPSFSLNAIFPLYRSVATGQDNFPCSITLLEEGESLF